MIRPHSPCSGRSGYKIQNLRPSTPAHLPFSFPQRKAKKHLILGLVIYLIALRSTCRPSLAFPEGAEPAQLPGTGEVAAGRIFPRSVLEQHLLPGPDPPLQLQPWIQFQCSSAMASPPAVLPALGLVTANIPNVKFHLINNMTQTAFFSPDPDFIQGRSSSK